MPPKRVPTAEQRKKGAAASKRWREKKRQVNPEYGKKETERTAVRVILLYKCVIRSGDKINITLIMIIIHMCIFYR